VRDRIALASLVVAVAGLATAFQAAGGPQRRPTPPPQRVSIEGTLVDTKCYSMDAGNSGTDHAAGGDTIQQCATACAKMGIPVAVLTAERDVYILLAPTPAFEDHMGAWVRVTGTKVFGGSAIRPDSVSARDADGTWSALDIRSMM
jgi:hypothetical protein